MLQSAAFVSHYRLHIKLLMSDNILHMLHTCTLHIQNTTLPKSPFSHVNGRSQESDLFAIFSKGIASPTRGVFSLPGAHHLNPTGC